MPQSARLTEGGVQSLFGQCPFEPGDNFGGASLIEQTTEKAEDDLSVTQVSAPTFLIGPLDLRTPRIKKVVTGVIS